MRFLYASDIHGDTNKYEKIFQRAITEKIEYIVLGGDLFPKRGNIIIIQPGFIKDYFEDYFKRLSDNNIKCILIPGNDDLEIFDVEINNLCDKYSNIYNIDKKRLDIEDVSFIGLSNVLDHPFGRKNRVLVEENLKMEPQLSPYIYINNGSEVMTIEEWKEYRRTNVEKMENVLASLPEGDKSKKTIYVFHDPPYGVGLDVTSGGLKVGSKAMNRFIENSNAYMSLHGHIHESPKMSGVWKNKLGKTVCIQPGQTELGEAGFYYVAIDTYLNRFELYSGSPRYYQGDFR